jgi:hypothetical protein
MRNILCLLLSLIAVSAAQAVPPVPLEPGHPVVGTWKFTLPSGTCSEMYYIHQDGTTLVTSGEEVVETIYEISSIPSARGFYKWVDKIVKDNGKKDCSGQTMQLGHEATNFIRVHPSGEMLVVCQKESLEACFGPLTRVRSEES